MTEEQRKAWGELQAWLMMNVGSREAEQCLAIVAKIINRGAAQCSTRS
jgi:hypothetical protein